MKKRIYCTKALELMALQTQMNPHFLFNTLKTIYWKAYSFTDSPNDVSRMVEKLSDMLSYSLDSPQKEVPVSMEIHHTFNYLEILKMRHKDKFDYICQCDDSILDIKVIKLILQPIVENSIYHGIMEKEGKCRIKINVSMQNGVLRFIVIDNGIGMTADALAQLRKEHLETADQYSETQRIGLYNTAKRLALRYGDSAGIHIRSKYRYGTSATITIPIDTHMEQSEPCSADMRNMPN